MEVTVIAAKTPEKKRLRVAAYCRVSTDNEDQEGSIENQKAHYEELINQNSDYENAGIYYDQGISGYKEDRPGFQKMMEDARAGKIDLIITKSITRFARNTDTILKATRELKELGIGVFFELQNMNTLTQDGELLMTIYAAFAQAESENYRDLSRLEIRRRFAEGKPKYELYKSFGYREGKRKGTFDVVPKEAEIIKQIYKWVRDEYAIATILKMLKKAGYHTRTGKDFPQSLIYGIVRNVIYKGDYIMQTTYRDDNRKMHFNKGEIQSWYIENDHQPIVTKKLWAQANEVLDLRAAERLRPVPILPMTEENYPYKNKLFCGYCGQRLHAVKAKTCLQYTFFCRKKNRNAGSCCQGITIAQEESVKKREAMNWSLAQRFKDGKLLTPALLGYDRQRDVTGRYIKYAPLVVNESEARIVRFIYESFLCGWTQEQIATFLTDIGCKTKSGATEWNAGSIGYILTNERYCGNVLTLKTFTADLYEHKHKKNRQDRDQYLYKDRHEAIVSVEQFEAVQVLLENHRHHLRGGLPLMHVIDEGIFRGFIPINHHWVNDDPGTYYDISNSIKQPSKVRQFEKKSFSAFDLKGYQVVRGQFMQLRFEGPCITISNERISFNKFCVQRFVNVAFIQLLLHPTKRRIAIRPCREDDAHSIRWRPDSDRPVYSKTFNCQHFGNALFSIMGWNPDYIYKIRGTWACRRSEQIIVYNLSNAMPAMSLPISEAGGVRRRIDLCPEEWEDNFGPDFYEHTLENGFYYIAPSSEWRSQAKSVLAPGINQLAKVSQEKLQLSIDSLKRRVETNNG